MVFFNKPLIFVKKKKKKKPCFYPGFIKKEKKTCFYPTLLPGLLVVPFHNLSIKNIKYNSSALLTLAKN